MCKKRGAKAPLFFIWIDKYDHLLRWIVLHAKNSIYP